jgi:hypothetical protein
MRTERLTILLPEIDVGKPLLSRAIQSSASGDSSVEPSSLNAGWSFDFIGSMLCPGRDIQQAQEEEGSDCFHGGFYDWQTGSTIPAAAQIFFCKSGS